MGNDTSYHTYILRCADGTLYTGWTNDLPHRIETHNAGTGAKYTQSRLPVELVYNEVYGTKQEAMKREYQIKHLSRDKKLHLIKESMLMPEKNIATGKTATISTIVTDSNTAKAAD